MTKKQELLKAYNSVFKAHYKLSAALQDLSEKASDYAGRDLQADICSGEEIEFREITNNPGFSDDYSTIRIEDLISEEYTK